MRTARRVESKQEEEGTWLQGEQALTEFGTIRISLVKHRNNNTQNSPIGTLSENKDKIPEGLRLHPHGAGKQMGTCKPHL